MNIFQRLLSVSKQEPILLFAVRCIVIAFLVYFLGAPLLAVSWSDATIFDLTIAASIAGALLFLICLALGPKRFTRAP
jgi:hypothetical protein